MCTVRLSRPGYQYLKVLTVQSLLFEHASLRLGSHGSVLTVRFSRFGSRGSVCTVRVSLFASHGSLLTVLFAVPSRHYHKQLSIGNYRSVAISARAAAAASSRLVLYHSYSAKNAIMCDGHGAADLFVLPTTGIYELFGKV